MYGMRISKKRLYIKCGDWSVATATIIFDIIFCIILSSLLAFFFFFAKMEIYNFLL